MSIARLVVVGCTIVANIASAGVDLGKVRFVLRNSAEGGVPHSWLPGLAALKAAGAVGLLFGLAGVPVLGIAASIGLIVFFLGAVLVHVRARVFHNIGLAATYLALAIGSLAVLTLG